VAGCAATHFLGKQRPAQKITNEGHHVAFPMKEAQIAVKHDPVKALVRDLNPTTK
jgi:hypothetical protein